MCHRFLDIKLAYQVISGDYDTVKNHVRTVHLRTIFLLLGLKRTKAFPRKPSQRLTYFEMTIIIRGQQKDDTRENLGKETKWNDQWNALHKDQINVQTLLFVKSCIT